MAVLGARCNFLCCFAKRSEVIQSLSDSNLHHKFSSTVRYDCKQKKLAKCKIGKLSVSLISVNLYAGREGACLAIVALHLMMTNLCS